MKDDVRDALERLAVCPIAQADLGHPEPRPECAGLLEALRHAEHEGWARGDRHGQLRVWRISPAGIDALDGNDGARVVREQLPMLPGFDAARVGDLEHHLRRELGGARQLAGAR